MSIIAYNQIITGNCIDVMKGMPDDCFDLVIGSPPYVEKGKRCNGGQLKLDDWLNLMVEATVESIRISRNVVIWVANGSMKNKKYIPACEGLVWECFARGITCERPAIWHKNSLFSRRDWFTNDWEYCLAFRPSNSSRYFDWQSLGTPPKYKNGGRFRQRTNNGKRRLGGNYPQNKLTHPRDVFRVTVGGGHLGSKLSHLNEAPFPEGIVSPFIKACCPPGGSVLDPFCGSGTTLAAAHKLGRQWVGIDIRSSQVTLSNERILEIV